MVNEMRQLCVCVCAWLSGWVPDLEAPSLFDWVSAAMCLCVCMSACDSL